MSRQTNLFEFLGDVEEALRQEIFKETSTEDETPTDFPPSSTPMTPIEKMITLFIEQCIDRKTIPTKEQAEVIYILDEVNSKYQG